MGLSAVGRHSSTTILGGVLKMWQQGQEITAALVAFCAVVAPTLHIVFMLTVLIAVRRSPIPRMGRRPAAGIGVQQAVGHGRSDDARHSGCPG